MYDPRVHIGTAAVIINPRRQLLMLQRGPEASHGAGQWSVPGGWLDYGETPEQTVLRELKEEVDISGSQASVVDIDVYTHAPPVDHVVCIFLQVPWHKDMTPKNLEPEKTSDVQWVPIEWVDKMDLFGTMRNFVDRNWLNLLSV